MNSWASVGLIFGMIGLAMAQESGPLLIESDWDRLEVGMEEIHGDHANIRPSFVFQRDPNDQIELVGTREGQRAEVNPNFFGRTSAPKVETLLKELAGFERWARNNRWLLDGTNTLSEHQKAAQERGGLGSLSAWMTIAVTKKGETTRESLDLLLFGLTEDLLEEYESYRDAVLGKGRLLVESNWEQLEVGFRVLACYWNYGPHLVFKKLPEGRVELKGMKELRWDEIPDFQTILEASDAEKILKPLASLEQRSAERNGGEEEEFSPERLAELFHQNTSVRIVLEGVEEGAREQREFDFYPDEEICGVYVVYFFSIIEDYSPD